MFWRNCTHNCKAAADAGGIVNGEFSKISVQEIFGMPVTIKSKPNLRPNNKMRPIGVFNPRTDVDAQLVPTIKRNRKKIMQELTKNKKNDSEK